MPYKCVVPGCRSNYYHVTGTASIQMIRFPVTPDLLAEWLRVIDRPGYAPNKNSHICVKHFAPEDTVRHEYLGSVRNSCRINKYYLRVKPGAVPSVFEPRPPPSVKKDRPTTEVTLPEAPCEILSAPFSGIQVEFKPEMWDDKSKSTEKEEEVVKKRGRGRPRKKRKINNENTSGNGNDTSVNGSSGMFSESVPCCALACPNTSDTHVMNHLPGEPSQRQLWIQNIDRLAWTPDNDSALCEIHFEQEMWDYNVGGEKSLKHDAVPTQYLHGEAIQSWVTLGNPGKVRVRKHEGEDENTPGSEWNEGDDEEMDEHEDIIVKHEALEPEIDMVEGSEEVMSKHSSEVTDPFETIFCDVAPDAQQDLPLGPKRIKLEKNDDEAEDGELETPPSPETVYLDDQCETNQSQGNLNLSIFDVKSLQDESVNKDDTLMISHSEYLEKWKSRRRKSTQLTDKFQCPICERRLSRKKNLEVHIRKLHPNGELTESQKRTKIFQEEVSVKFKKSKKKQEQPKFVRVDVNSSSPPPAQTVDPLDETVVTPAVDEEDTHSPTTIVTSPRPLDPSPAGGEMKKQFLVFIPSTSNEKILPPIVNLDNAPAEKKTSSSVEGPTFSLRLINLPAEKKISPPDEGPTFTVDLSDDTGEIKISPPNEGPSSSVNLLNGPAEKKIPPSSSVNVPENKISPAGEGSSFSINLSSVPAEKRLALRIKLRELVDAVAHKNLDPERIIIAYDRT